MTNAPFALDRREFIALAGGLAAVLVVGDGAYFSSRRSAAHAQPVPSESGTLTQPETPLNGTIASPNTETAAAATTSPETESAAATNTEMPPTTLEDLPWNLRLVNRDHPLAADFAPSNLAELPDASWVEPHVNHRVDARIVEDLTAMLTAAEAAGTHPIICSSFRTYDYQENLFENRIERAEREEHLEGTEAEEAAAFWVAPPGASEHQTGLAAVDPLESTSRALDPEIVGQEHYDVAMGVQQILQQYKDLQDIIAILGMDELSEDQKLTVNRARKVQKFLGQPFHVAEVFTGLPGVYVKVEDTVRSFKEILDGKCDHIPEQCFVNKGAIEQVYEAYDAMQKEGN